MPDLPCRGATVGDPGRGGIQHSDYLAKPLAYHRIGKNSGYDPYMVSCQQVAKYLVIADCRNFLV